MAKPWGVEVLKVEPMAARACRTVVPEEEGTGSAVEGVEALVSLLRTLMGRDRDRVAVMLESMVVEDSWVSSEVLEATRPSVDSTLATVSSSSVGLEVAARVARSSGE